VRFCGTDSRLNAFPFNSRMVSPPVFAPEFYNAKRRASCRRKPDLFAQLSLVLQCFAQCPYRWNVRQHQASWCLLVRHKPIMVTIDASLDELTGATIIITATTDRLCPARSDPG